MDKFIEFSHKGWFGLCPVIIGDPTGQCYIDCRWEWMNFLMDVQCVLFGAAVAIRQFFDPYYRSEGWNILITGELTPPIRRSLLP